MEASPIWTSLGAWRSLLTINSRQPLRVMATISSACTTPTASRSLLGSPLPSGYARSECRLRCSHRAPTYPPPPLPLQSRFGCGLLGASSSCPKMNEVELSPEVSCVSAFLLPMHMMLLLEG